MSLIFDIEADGLLDTVTTVWCLVTYNVTTKEFSAYSDYDDSLPKLAVGLQALGRAGELVGHNILGFDLPALSKVAGFVYSGRVVDTLNVSRLVYPSLVERDSVLARRKILPKGMVGKHSLKAWGYRLMYWKDEFEDWSKYTPKMLEYCKRDVNLTQRLYTLLMSKLPSKESIDLEIAFQKVILEQEKQGVPFNTEAAKSMAVTLLADKQVVTDEIRAIVPTHTTYVNFTPKKDNATKGWVKDRPIRRHKTSAFNPGSRLQIIQFLKGKYSWEPYKMTDNGNPALDEEVLEGLPYPEAKLFLRYFTINKLLGQLSTGPNSWLNFVKDGRIHGKMITNGCITGRTSHYGPNLGNIPSASSFMGKEVRSLFHAPEGWVLVGCDASKLELVCLAHFLAKFDMGTYAREVESGDVHELNRQSAELPDRATAKRFIYAFLYGAGSAKLGSIVAPIETLVNQKNIGSKAKNDLFRKLPALKNLQDDVIRTFNSKKYLTGLDGRKLVPRQDHSALNTLLQGAGAVLMKKATVIFWDMIRDKKIEAYPALHCHDEFQVICRPEDGVLVGKTAVEAIEWSGRDYKLRCFLTGEYKIGKTWAETH